MFSVFVSYAVFVSYVACFLAGVAIGVAVQTWRETRDRR